VLCAQMADQCEQMLLRIVSFAEQPLPEAPAPTAAAAAAAEPAAAEPAAQTAE
jgi:hypothetical protein